LLNIIELDAHIQQSLTKFLFLTRLNAPHHLTSQKQFTGH